MTMLHKIVTYSGNRYEITKFNASTSEVELQPECRELSDLIRRMIITNTPFHYYYTSDTYGPIEPNTGESKA